MAEQNFKLSALRVESIELGNDTDTTLSRDSAGNLASEGRAIGGKLTTTSVTANTATTVDSFALSAADSVEFTVRVKQAGRRYSSKALAIHDGTTVSFSQSASVSINPIEAVAGTGAVTWVTRTPNFGTSNIFSVAYGNNLWVAGGANGSIRTSTDAITWTTRTSAFANSFSGTIRTVAFGNNVWLAGAVYGIRSSTDAITWTTRVDRFFSGDGTYSAAFANNLWVAGGENSSSANIKRSTDGITWTSNSRILYTAGFGGTIRSVAYGNALWVAGGDSGRLASSTDALTWVTQTPNFGTTRIRSIAYGNTVWVAGGETGQLRTSTDAITWTTRTSTFGTSDIRSVAFSNNLWVAAGYTGQLRTSTDAITWTTRTSTFGTSTIFSAAYGNALWVAGGETGQLRTSAADTAAKAVPLTLSADISGSDVRLLATITDAATTTAEVKILKTTL